VYIDGKEGSYFGETKDGIPDGRGIFIAWENNIRNLPQEIVTKSFK